MRLSAKAAGVAVLLASCTTASAPESPSVSEITIMPRVSNSLVAVKVELGFIGSATGETVLTMPDSWGPEENLGAMVTAFTALDEAGNRAVMEADSGHFTLQHEPGARLRVSYVVEQDYEGEPKWGVQRVPGMRPVLQPAYATLIGHAILPDISVPQDFALRLGGDSEGVAVFSRPLQDGATAPQPLNQLRDSIVLMGDFRYAEDDADGLNVRTAIRGTWALPDDEISQLTRDVLKTGGEIFADQPFHQYLVAINAMPALPEGSVVIGTGLSESFFILATPNADAENLRHTIIHELLHEWITRRMGVTDEATDPLRMWFTEGFTEYYTQIVLLKSGEVSLEGFVNNVNDLLRNYEASPVRNLPVSDLAEQIWDSREAERLPYQRGALLAFHWDMMQSLTDGQPLSTAIADLISQRDDRLTDEEILSALSDVVGARARVDVDRFIRSGETIDVSAFDWPDCIKVETQEDGRHAFAIREGADVAACVRTVTRG
jgi:predicted metalloprotease with PDZ domain